MPDEVAKLAEKLGEVMIESPWQGGICGPTEYVTLRSVLVCAADNDMGQLEALARVALEFRKDQEIAACVKAWTPTPDRPIGIANRDIKPGETVTLSEMPGADIELFPGVFSYLAAKALRDEVESEEQP